MIVEKYRAIGSMYSAITYPKLFDACKKVPTCLIPSLLFYKSNRYSYKLRHYQRLNAKPRPGSILFENCMTSAPLVSERCEYKREEKGSNKMSFAFSIVIVSFLFEVSFSPSVYSAPLLILLLFAQHLLFLPTLSILQMKWQRRINL